MRERVEERRLAGVRVADEREREHLAARARAPLHGPLALEPGEARPQDLHPPADQPSVGLELGLARAAQPDAAFLPLEVGPAAHQPGRLVLELRELHLHLAFVRARTLREDVEDQAGPIDDAAADGALEIALLRGRELVVEDHDRGAGRCAHPRELLDLARTGEERQIGTAPPSLHDREHARAGARDERLELGAARGVVVAAEVERDQDRAFGCGAVRALGARGERAGRHYLRDIRSRRLGPG